jgi:hypothetical protein
MTEAFLKELKGLEFDSLTAKEAVLLRSALTEAMAKADRWFQGLARDFGQPAEAAKALNGRPPDVQASTATPPVKAPKRRGRPVPNLKVDLKVNRPAPLAVGGADVATDAPKPAQIFQESYVSKDGPRPGSTLPADHPRNSARPSSVTPEVDMSDFAEVEKAMRKGELGKMFQ